jgi:hypothetical protein
MGGKSSPPPPDYGPLAEQAEKAAELGYAASQEQLAWAREQWADQKDLLNTVLQTQLPIMQEQFENAQADRARYEELYQPLEENLIQEFQTYDTEERRQLEAGRAIADVTRAFEAQRENAQRQLESYGVDPSETRAQALDLGIRAQAAASQAAAGTQAVRRVEDVGRALRAEAINIGKGMPSQVAAAYGQSLTAGSQAVGNMGSTVGTGASALSSGTGWMSAGTQANQAGVNALNTGFSNALAGKQYEAEWGLPGMVTTGAGIAAGIMA